MALAEAASSAFRYAPPESEHRHYSRAAAELSGRGLGLKPHIAHCHSVLPER